MKRSGVMSLKCRPSSGPERRAGGIPRRQQEDAERRPPRPERPRRPRQVQDPASDPPGQHQAEDRRVRGLVENLRPEALAPKYLVKAPTPLFADASFFKFKCDVITATSDIFFLKTQKSVKLLSV